MMEMTGRVLRDAAAFVDACAELAELHTVKLELDGASGGAILTIQGAIDLEIGSEDFEHKYIVGGTRDGEEITT